MGIISCPYHIFLSIDARSAPGHPRPEMAEATRRREASDRRSSGRNRCLGRILHGRYAQYRVQIALGKNQRLWDFLASRKSVRQHFVPELLQSRSNLAFRNDVAI